MPETGSVSALVPCATSHSTNSITLPRLRFTLLEATGKKAEFLRRVVSDLGLENATVLNARAEQAGQDRGEKVPQGARTVRVGAHREAYDAVIARAVGKLATLATTGSVTSSSANTVSVSSVRSTTIVASACEPRTSSSASPIRYARANSPTAMPSRMIPAISARRCRYTRKPAFRSTGWSI